MKTSPEGTAHRAVVIRKGAHSIIGTPTQATEAWVGHPATFNKRRADHWLWNVVNRVTCTTRPSIIVVHIAASPTLTLGGLNHTSHHTVAVLASPMFRYRQTKNRSGCLSLLLLQTYKGIAKRSLMRL